MADRILQPHVWTPPSNETKEHYLLKNLARIYLVEKGMRYVGTEIYINGRNDENSKKKVIDCVGVDKSQTISYGIEAKVSKSDFKNGYCSRCNYTYIICPKDMISKEDVPDYIGLIYVDIDNALFIPNAKENRLQGITLVKKSKYHINDVYWYYEDGIKTDYYNDDMMFAYTQMMVERINRSNLNELIYNTNRIPMAKITKGRRRWK